MSSQKTHPKVTGVSHFLWLVHDLQASRLCSGWGELGPGWKITSSRELEVASGSLASSDSGIVWSGRLGPNLQDEDEALGVGAAIRSTCASVFFVFFFSFVAGGRAAGERSRPFSLDAFLNVPSYLFSSR